MFNMQSARKRGELYVGLWLPEPAIADGGFGGAVNPLESGTGKNGNPANYIERQENITYVMLVILERLIAVERSVFLLRETLDFDYGEIADIVQKSEANCRKILSRAKEKLQGSAGEGDSAEANDPMRRNKEQAWVFAKAFMQAAPPCFAIWMAVLRPSPRLPPVIIEIVVMVTSSSQESFLITLPSAATCEEK